MAQVVSPPAVPATMHAVRLYEYGDPDVLRYEEAPVPAVGPDDVLVRVRATSVNWWDLRYRQGRLGLGGTGNAPRSVGLPGRDDLPLPFQPGREAAGEVAALGENVRGLTVGDRVVTMTCPACGHCAWCRCGQDNLCTTVGYPGHQRFGGYAEYVAVPATEVLRAPEGVPFEKLACTLWSYATVWHMAVARGGLTAGQSVLVTAASSGMGTAALQVARLAGAGPIIALTGSPAKMAALRDLGADHVLDYKALGDDLPAHVKALTPAVEGVDLVLDCVGGPLFGTVARCLRMNGTLVAAGSMGGRDGAIDVGSLYRMQLNVLGSRAARRQDPATVLRLVGDGRLDPVIAATFPLREAAEAHRWLERQVHVGKVVLLP